MSGIVGGVGARSGGSAREIKNYYCHVQLSGDYAINTTNGWSHPGSSEIEAFDDPHGWWNDTTRILTPKKSGHYYCYSNAMLSNSTDANYFGNMLVFSGTDFSGGIHQFAYTTAVNDATGSIHATVYFDGVDDNVYPTYFNSLGTNLNVVGGRYTQFGIIWIGE